MLDFRMRIKSFEFVFIYYGSLGGVRGRQTPGRAESEARELSYRSQVNSHPIVCLPVRSWKIYVKLINPMHCKVKAPKNSYDSIDPAIMPEKWSQRMKNMTDLSLIPSGDRAPELSF